jgi:multidrug efflux pump
MKLTEICIRRPVLSTVLSLALIVIGLVTFRDLQIRHYPKVDKPVVSVTTQLEGASPEIIESQITKVIEDSLAGIAGVEKMTSRSQTGQSSISVTFSLDRDIEGATNDVRDKISRVLSKLPQDIQKPLIRKADADAVPMLYLALWSTTQEIKDVADYATRELESLVQTVGGVAAVEILGGGDYQMHVRLNPIRLAAYGLSADDVSNALKQQSFEKPAGTLVTEDRQILVTTRANLQTEEEFRNVIVAEHKGYLVRIRDVVEDVSFDAVEKQVKVRFNGHEAVALSITSQSVANPLDVSRGISELLPRIRTNLPRGMHIDVANDKSIFIEKSIQEVYWTILEATLLVILVIFIFLRSVRASIIPIVTIPLSLIGTFALMNFFGFTINVLTLLALVMAIGLVVDDAIVILENIYRYIEKGMKPMEAAFKGASEISFAIIAMTITLAAVYAPIALSSGFTGQIFKEFALTLAGAVIISGFIALTLSPMMCSRFLKVHKIIDHESKAQVKQHPIRSFFYRLDALIDHGLDYLDLSYGRLLDKALKKPITVPIKNKTRTGNRKVQSSFLVVMFSILIGLSGIYIGFTVKQDLSSPEDQGFVKAKAFPPQGASLSYVDRYMKQAEEIFDANVPELERQLSIIWAEGEPIIENYLVPWEKRSRSSLEISDAVRPLISDGITGMHFTVWGRGYSLIGGGQGRPIEFIVQTTKSYDELKTIFTDLVREVEKIPGIFGLEDTRASDEQQYVVEVDRDKAAQLRIEVREIGDMLDTLIKGRPAVYFKNEGQRYPVTVELAEKFRRSGSDIESLYIRAKKQNKDVMVPLSEVVTVRKLLVPTEIHHFSGLRSITGYGNLLPGYGMDEVLNQIQEVAQRILPEGSRLDFSGESKTFFEEGAKILLIFMLAVISIYLVLSAQYESFLDPLIIMMSVPLSLIGGLVTLMIATGMLSMVDGFPQFTMGSLTIFGKIGLVTLIGLITKHGILIVDFANAIVAKGKSRVDAVIEASKLRLRPILMTTFAMVLGAIPLALASGAGAESRAQIGWVVVGGMSIGTFFTLFVVPAFYIYISAENLRRLFGLKPYNNSQHEHKEA